MYISKVTGPPVSYQNGYNGFAGVDINFYTREQIPVGFEVVPAPVPAGINSDPYSCPFASTQIFPACCHL
jgi:hypothetical protein